MDEPLTIKAYQDASTINDKMHALPAGNKREFIMRVGDDLYRADTGLDYAVTMRTIERLKAKEKRIQELQEKEQQLEERETSSF